MKKYTLILGFFMTGFWALMPMEPIQDNVVFSELISAYTAQVPDDFSLQSKNFLKMHLLFAQLEESWLDGGVDQYVDVGMKLEALLHEANPAMAQEALSTLVNIFFFHRPLNIEKAALCVDILCQASVELLSVLNAHLIKAGIKDDYWNGLVPHKKLVLYVLIHNKTLVTLMNEDFIIQATSFSVIEKIVISFNLLKIFYQVNGGASNKVIKVANDYDLFLKNTCAIIQKNYDYDMQKFLYALQEDDFVFEKMIFYDDFDSFRIFFNSVFISGDEYCNPFDRWHALIVQVVAFAGASRIFKFLFLCDTASLRFFSTYDQFNVLRLAICGNDFDIIHLCEKIYMYTPDTYNAFLNEAISWHRIFLINYFKEKVSVNDYELENAIVFKNIPYFLWMLSTPLRVSSNIFKESFGCVGNTSGSFWARILLEIGVDVNCGIKNNTLTPLFAAIRYGNIELISFLLELGASVSTMCAGYGVWYQVKIMIENIKNSCNVLSMVLDHRFIPPWENSVRKDSKDSYAVYKEEVVKPIFGLLVAAGACLDEKDSEGDIFFTHLLKLGERDLFFFMLKLKDITLNDSLFKIKNNRGESVEQVWIWFCRATYRPLG